MSTRATCPGGCNATVTRWREAADYPEPDAPERCTVFVCAGCGVAVPMCQGGAPDDRCDACVMCERRAA